MKVGRPAVHTGKLAVTFSTISQLDEIFFDPELFVTIALRITSTWSRIGARHISTGGVPPMLREGEHLKAHLDLLQCYYNFIRSHDALKFGQEIRTLAMQAGLAKKPQTFRQIFMIVLF